MNSVSHRLAELDLLHAIAYYDEQAPGLGAEFLRAFEEALAVIRRHPEAAPAVRGEIRRLWGRSEEESAGFREGAFMLSPVLS